MTDPDRLQELFARAVDLDSAARERLLEAECSGDAELLAEARALLAGDAAADRVDAWRGSALELEAAQAKSAIEESLGESIGPYRLDTVVGRGGMGKVYRAVRSDSEYQQVVAVKLIRGGADADEIVARFRTERQILATLEHPHIARLLDGGTTARGLPYLVMEFIDGEPLDLWLRKRAPSLAEKLRMFREICSAVHYAHQRMVVHRDLKPANILVNADGVPKLVDFGISKLLHAEAGEPSATMAGSRLMTPRYASPEQVRGEPVTTASDVYSLGVILYEMLAGRSPYTAPESAPHELMGAVADEMPQRPSLYGDREVRGDLDNIVLMALRKDPKRRYASVDQLSEDIRRFEEGYPVIARPDTPWYRLVN